MNGENIWKPAIIGGILLGVLSSLPYLNCACCVWIIGAAALASYLYVRESPFVVTLGRGVLLGLATGIIGTVVAALFAVPLLLMSPEGSSGIIEQVRQMADQMPSFPAESRKAFDELSSREGFLIFLYISSMAVQLVVNCLLAMLGGALGVALFEKRKSGVEIPKPPDALPPQPPDA